WSTPKQGDRRSTFTQPADAPDAADDPLPSLSALARAEGAVEVMVGVAPGHDAVGTVAAVTGVPADQVRPVIEGVVALTVDDDQLTRLEADPAIATIERNAPLELTLAVS